MPQPTPGDVHVNRPLTNLSIGFLQKSDMFLSNTIFPVVPVQQRSDQYTVYDRGDFWRSEARERAPGTESAGGGYRLRRDTYYTPVYAVHKDVDDQTRANASAPVQPDREAALWVTQQLAIKRDKIWADNFFSTGIWDIDRDGVAASPTGSQFLQWDQGGSTPIADLRADIIAIAAKTGMKPNVLGLGARVWATLQDHSDFIERVKYSERAIIGPDLLAAVLEIDKVVIGWGVETTSAEDQAADESGDTIDFINGNHALLAYAAPNPGLFQPSAGYTFSWTGYLGAGNQGNRIKQFRMEQNASDRIEGEMAFDHQVVAAELGAFYEDAVA